MSLATGVTLMGRRQAEALMESACVITRAGETTTDPVTGEDVPTSTTIYTGKCRLKFPNAQATQVEAAGQLLATQFPVLSLPVDGSAGVLMDDVATVTSPLDPDVTVVARIAGLHSQTHATARRFPLEVLSNG